MKTVFQQFRQANSLSQAALAEQLGVGQTSISHYETGKRSPDKHLVKKFIELTGKSGVIYTADQVLFGVDQELSAK